MNNRRGYLKYPSSARSTVPYTYCISHLLGHPYRRLDCIYHGLIHISRSIFQNLLFGTNVILHRAFPYDSCTTSRSPRSSHNS